MTPRGPFRKLRSKRCLQPVWREDCSGRTTLVTTTD